MPLLERQLQVFLLCLVATGSYAQDEIPVNMYTGTPGISIPIWNVTAQDLSQPVSLSYNASGLKLGESEGWFGVGWDLSANGSITREVRGFPDDLYYLAGSPRKGWLYTNGSGTGIASDVAAFTASADLTSTTCNDEQVDQAKINGYKSDRIDTEPDLFSYNFGGYSGSFVFDNSTTPQIRFIPYRDFKVSYTTVSTGNKSIMAFTIRTNDGVTYTFARTVSMTRKISGAPQAVTFLWRDYDFYENQDIIYTVEWKLTRIESPSGAFIDFSYSSDSSDDTEKVVPLGIYSASAAAVKTVPAYTIATKQDRYWLDYIVSSTGQKVEFKKPGTTLDKIRILDSRRGTGDELVKEFLLSYTLISRPGDAAGGKFLDQVSETSGCDRMPPYQFSYTGMNASANVPDPIQDFWGYYNGKTGVIGFPKIYVYPDEPLAERFRLYPIPGYSGTQVVLDGDDRTPDENFMKIGTLNRIDYPSGGSTVLQYEGNKYFDTRTGQNQSAGGLRIRSITQYDGMNAPLISKTFEYTNPSNTQQSSGRLISKPEFVMPAWKYRDPTAMDNASSMISYSTLSTRTTDELWKMLTIRTTEDLSEQTMTQGSAVGYEYVMVRRAGAGAARYEFLVPGKYGESSSGYWSATENKFARPVSCPTMGIVSTGGKWAFPRSRNPEFDFERGLVLRKHEFNDTGAPVRLVENEYQYLYRSGPGSLPVNVWGLQYERYPNSDDPIYFYGKYFLPTEYDRVLKKETVTTYDAATTAKNLVESTEYFYESANHRQLSRMERISGDGTMYITKMKYPLDFDAIPSNADNALLRIKDLQDPALFRHNVVIEQQSLIIPAGGTESLTGASLVKFNDFSIAGKILPQEQLSLSLASPVTDFQEATMVLDGSTYKFKPDARYETVNTILQYDAFDKPVAAVGADKIPSATVWGFDQSIPVASVTNAKRGEFAFSDFETATGDAFDLTNVFYAAPRSGSKGLHPYATLQKTVAKQADNYHLTFWFTHNTAITFRVTIKNTALSTTYYDQTFSVTPSASGFVYVDKVIPVASSPTQFVIQLAGQSLSSPSASSPTLAPSIDDVAFYPDHASLVSYAYNFPFGAALVTSQGIARRSVYDKLGRVTQTFDENDNMLSRNTYTFGKPLFPVDASFSVLSTLYYGEPISFSAVENNCLTGVTHEWDFGTGTFVPGGAQATHTFTDVSKSTYTVRHRVSYDGGAPVTKTQILTMKLKPISVSGCANGTITYNTCGEELERITSCIEYPTPTHGTVFYASVSESIPGTTFTWKKRSPNTYEWVAAGSGPQFTITYLKPNTLPFELKCEVLTPDGRSGEYHPQLSIIVCEHTN